MSNVFAGVRWIWMNGRLVEFEKANIHVMTHALHYGSGVFEGIRCYDTRRGPAVFRLPEHIRRLELSAKVYRMDLTSGEVIPLLSAPDKEMVFDLKLSADGVALAVCTQPHPAGRRGKKAMHCAWTVWSYQALRAGATVS